MFKKGIFNIISNSKSNEITLLDNLSLDLIEAVFDKILRNNINIKRLYKHVRIYVIKLFLSNIIFDNCSIS